MGIHKLKEDASAEEDSAFSAETRVGEQAYQAIAQLMSFASNDKRLIETLPPPSVEPGVESGVRRALTETPTVPAPPMPTESSNEPPGEPTQLLVASGAGRALVALSPRERGLDPVTLPSMLGPMHRSSPPVAISVMDIGAQSPLPIEVIVPRRRWRLVSVEALIFGFAFSATLAFVFVTAWFLVTRR